MATTITFDHGAYGGRPTLDETAVDTEGLDYGAYGGRSTVYPEAAGVPPAAGNPWYYYAQQEAVA